MPDMHTEFDIFWMTRDPGDFRRGFARTVEILNISPETFSDRMKQYGFIDTPDERSLRRLIPLKSTSGSYKSTKRLRSAIHMSAVVEACRIALEKVPSSDRERDPHLRRLLELGEQMEKEISAPLLASLRHPDAIRSAAIYTPTTIMQMLNFIGTQINVSPRAFVDIASMFFKDWTGELPERPLQRNFIGYRFHSTPKKIVKSFVALFSPSISEPYCRFGIFFNDGLSDTPRETRGLLFPMAEAIYFFGQTDNGTGLKLMAFDNLRTGRLPRRYFGLALTMDNGGQPVAARFIMEPTEHSDDVAADCGLKDLEDVRSEIGEELNAIRNVIGFDVEGELLLGDRVVGQDAMVAEVGRRMSGPLGEQVRLRGSDGEVREFNPASARDYTFNAALPMPGPSTRTER